MSNPNAPARFALHGQIVAENLYHDSVLLMTTESVIERLNTYYAEIVALRSAVEARTAAAVVHEIAPQALIGEFAR